MNKTSPGPGIQGRPRPTPGQAGSTILEALIGTAIAAVGISGLCVANANCLGIARAHKEVLIADQCLQQRSEQYRSATWSQLTDAASVTAMLNVQPVNYTTPLDGQTETITVSPYPPVTPPVTPLVITRDATGTTRIVSQPPSGFYLRNSV